MKVCACGEVRVYGCRYVRVYVYGEEYVCVDICMCMRARVYACMCG